MLKKRWRSWARHLRGECRVGPGRRVRRRTFERGVNARLSGRRVVRFALPAGLLVNHSLWIR